MQLLNKIKEFFCWTFLVGWEEISRTPDFADTELYGWTVEYRNRKTKEIRVEYITNQP